jgi:hypothetical protein
VSRRRSGRDPDESGPWLVVSGIVLGSIVVLGGVILLTRPSPGRKLGVRSAPSASASPPALASTNGACNVPGDGTTTGLDAVPGDFTWVVFDGSVAPTSRSAGPMVSDGMVARCFAHDAAGALIASVRIQEQIAGATARTWPAAVAGMAPGPLTDAIRAEGAAVLAAPSPPPGAETPFAAVAGFKFLAYSPTSAVIDLVYRDWSGGLYASSQTLDWVAGDWRMVPLGPNEISSPPTTVPDLVGYVPWTQP